MHSSLARGSLVWDLVAGVTGTQASASCSSQAGRGGACGYGPFPIQVGTSSLRTPASGPHSVAKDRDYQHDNDEHEDGYVPMVDAAVVVMMLSSKRPAPRERESRAGRRRNPSRNCEPLLQLDGLFEPHQESRPRRMDPLSLSDSASGGDTFSQCHR
jgi:hypothetical protein